MKFQKYITQKKEYALTSHTESIKELIQSGRNILNLTIGDPIEDTYPPVYKSLKLLTLTNSQYPQNIGSIAYRQSVADWCKRQYDQQYCPQKQIISCNGTKEAIFHIPLLFDWSENKQIFIPELSYPVYESSAQIFDISVYKVPTNFASNFLPDLDKITQEQWQRCQIFWLNSPHNPTTAIANYSYIEKLLKKAEEHDFLVCSDECYNDLFYSTEKPASCLQFPQYKNWLVFRSLSKRSHMTGFRIGALVSSNDELIANYSRLRSPMGIGSPTFIQEAAIEAWQDDKHPQEFCQRYKKKRDVIVSSLQKKGFVIFGAKAGFYLWFSHPKLPSAQEIYQTFLDNDVAITRGDSFGEAGHQWCRLTYCITDEQVKQLVDAIDRIEL